jgi:mannose-6-phosphate isomerase-like protein (cupin superfamily)
MSCNSRRAIARVAGPWALVAALLGCGHGPAVPAQSAPEPTLAPAALPAASVDALFGSERKTAILVELAQAAALAPDQDFKIIEVGRDAHTSHHIVALRGREPLHRHDTHDLIVYNFKGQGSMLLGDEERRIGTGSIVYVPRGTVHSMRNASAEPMLGYATFSPPFDGQDRVSVP